MKDWRRFWQAQVRQTPQDKPLGRTVCWLENPRPAPFPLQQSSSRPGHLKSPCQPQQFVEFCLEWPPWSNQCPETSTEQKTIKKLCGFCQGPQLAKRMDAGKMAEGGFLRWIFCWITSQSAQILQETYWSPHGSEIHPENSQVWWRKNHGLGLHPVWGCARDLQGGRQHQ